jgi:hypothetical protein
VALERRDVRSEDVGQLASPLLAERAGHSDMPQVTGGVMEAEQQRADGRPVDQQAAPRHHAIGRRLALDL